jgi:hypothetical protein
MLATGGFCWQLIMAGQKIKADLHVSNSSVMKLYVSFENGASHESQ